MLNKTSPGTRAAISEYYNGPKIDRKRRRVKKPDNASGYGHSKTVRADIKRNNKFAFRGKKHSEVTKARMRVAHADRFNKPKSNSYYRDLNLIRQHDNQSPFIGPPPRY